MNLGTEALRRAGYDLTKYSPEYVAAALATCKGKVKRFGELGPYAWPLLHKTEIKIEPRLGRQRIHPENKARLEYYGKQFRLHLKSSTPPELNKH